MIRRSGKSRSKGLVTNRRRLHRAAVSSIPFIPLIVGTMPLRRLVTIINFIGC